MFGGTKTPQQLLEELRESVFQVQKLGTRSSAAAASVQARRRERN